MRFTWCRRRRAQGGPCGRDSESELLSVTMAVAVGGAGVAMSPKLAKWQDVLGPMTGNGEVGTLAEFESTAGLTC